jgi:DNA-binding transcriptional LysR family regulator
MIDRASRGIHLTSEAEIIVSRGINILAEVDELTDILSRRRDFVTGHLRVFTPLGFGRRYVAPATQRFRRLYPDVTVELVLNNQGDHILREAHDLIIHVGELRNSARTFRRIAPNRRLVCAAPEYLERRGVPTSPDELRNHNCIVLTLDNDEDASLWRFNRISDNRVRNVRVRACLSANDGEVVRQWGVLGEGIFVRSEWDLRDDIRAGRLQVILEDWAAPKADVIAYLSPRAERPRRVERFLQCLKADLTPPPWRC